MAERPGEPVPARVVERTVLSDHLVRLVLEPRQEWTSTGVLDEWVALRLPDQFQTRYYTVRAARGGRIVVDVVVHAEGLVTRWAQTDCVGQDVGVSAPKGSYAAPEDAGWLVLVGDLTALPAIARVVEETTDLPGRPRVLLEVPAGTRQSYPDLDEARADVTWLEPPGPDESALAEVVAGIDWPEGPGYFWMAGESAQMREIRRHLRRDVGFGTDRFDVMGYWSQGRARQTRRVDPRPAHERSPE
ncbi:siderophore-interacting protein [Marmoricola endophyticus]|uniref:Siderophore-interacting protein n=1 Tax=Marmoricola endophyticus TaxID=2040280 RepID=A0A917EYB5_9ACTN|nr:siderophore-interacting protein [Marmoricola endophyticus]GGF31817.1 siderophore-interacting protein [Marmoricola endophyticus]